MYINYIIILILGCIDYFFHYKFITYIRKDLTEKQKSQILSIKSSLTLFLIGIYFNYFYFTSGFNEEKFFNILNEKNNLDFGILIILYFTAYLLTDMFIGYFEYPEQMQSISGNFHHKCYTIVNMLSLYFGLYPLYLLHLISELPSFLLSIGSFDNDFRNDALFGTTFFMTRIVYHIYLTYTFRKHSILFYLSLAALCLHAYWFYGWWNKYSHTLFKKEKKHSLKKNLKKNKDLKIK